VESDGIRHDHHASLEAKQRHALHTDTQSPASQAGREKSLPSSATMQHTMNGTAQQVDQHKHAAVPDHHVEVLTAVDPDEILHSCPSVGAESEEWADAEFMSCRQVACWDCSPVLFKQLMTSSSYLLRCLSGGVGCKVFSQPSRL
jgi:hypothetical protein